MKHTWDFPVPVAPIIAIKGRCGHINDMMVAALESIDRNKMTFLIIIWLCHSLSFTRIRGPSKFLSAEKLNYDIFHISLPL